MIEPQPFAISKTIQRPVNFGIGGVRRKPFAVFGSMSIFLRRGTEIDPLTA